MDGMESRDKDEYNAKAAKASDELSSDALCNGKDGDGMPVERTGPSRPHLKEAEGEAEAIEAMECGISRSERFAETEREDR